MNRITRHKDARDLRENGRVVLALGEVTGHMHEVVLDHTNGIVDDGEVGVGAIEYFAEPDGTRMLLLVGGQATLTHQEHGAIALDAAAAARGARLLASGVPNGTTIPGQYRQGDVLLHPRGYGAWEVRRQEERRPDGWRVVSD